MTYFYILIAFFPCIVWFLIFGRHGRIYSIPLPVVMKPFLLIMLIIFPVAILGRLVEKAFFIQEQMNLNMPVISTWFLPFVRYFLFVGPAEEWAKYAAVRYSVFKGPHFREPIDGAFFGAAAGAGFAAFENYLYISHYGGEIAFARGLLCASSHILYSSVCCYYALGLAKFAKTEAYRKEFVAKGFLIAICSHGSWNLLCTKVRSRLAGYTGLVIILLITWAFFRHAVAQSKRLSAKAAKIRKARLKQPHPEYLDRTPCRIVNR